MDKDELKAALTDRIEKGKALGLLTLPTRDDMAGRSYSYVRPVTREFEVKKRKYIDEFRKWSAYNVELLKHAFGSPDNEYIKRYESAGRTTYVFTRISDFVKIYQREITGKIGYLESLVERMPLLPEIMEKQSVMETTDRKDSHRIFIVHGHDSDLRTQVENFVRQLDYEPIVLFKRPSMGGTIIEKIEREAGDVAFAIVLYTACDLGNDKERVHDITDLNSRARQNVVFEHGYMCALLGCSRVCAVVEEGVEIPGGNTLTLSGELLIGGDASCGILLTGAAAPRRAARLLLEDGFVCIEALDAQVQVLVNGEPLTGSRRLRSGSCVSIGGREIRPMF